MMNNVLRPEYKQEIADLIEAITPENIHTVPEDNDAMKALEALNKTIDLVDHESGEPIPTPFKNFLSDDVYKTIRTALQKSAQVDGLVKALEWAKHRIDLSAWQRETMSDTYVETPIDKALQQFSGKDKSK